MTFGAGAYALSGRQFYPVVLGGALRADRTGQLPRAKSNRATEWSDKP
jgi:hypothetical protein